MFHNPCNSYQAKAKTASTTKKGTDKATHADDHIHVHANAALEARLAHSIILASMTRKQQPITGRRDHQQVLQHDFLAIHVARLIESHFHICFLLMLATEDTGLLAYSSSLLHERPLRNQRISQAFMVRTMALSTSVLIGIYTKALKTCLHVRAAKDLGEMVDLMHALLQNCWNPSFTGFTCFGMEYFRLPYTCPPSDFYLVGPL